MNGLSDTYSSVWPLQQGPLILYVESNSDFYKRILNVLLEDTTLKVCFVVSCLQSRNEHILIYSLVEVFNIG